MRFFLFSFTFLLVLASCSDDDYTTSSQSTSFENAYTYLALGDSYTVGQSVCSSCSFPEQLATRLNEQLERPTVVTPVAVTGWTTTNLLNGISSANLQESYDLVTLLIGVNNQFRNLPFETFEQEFLELLDRAIDKAGGDISKVIVLSIPDYTFTPFGSGLSASNSTEIDLYNNYIQSQTALVGVRYVNITDITRRGLDEPRLVASDGLHCSEVAYALFVDRFYSAAVTVIKE